MSRVVLKTDFISARSCVIFVLTLCRNKKITQRRPTKYHFFMSVIKNDTMSSQHCVIFFRHKFKELKKTGKNDTKSVFFPYNNQRPTVRKITDIVTAETKSGCQFFRREVPILWKTSRSNIFHYHF
jgi:hypothetical protein